jgi:carbamoyl-phosphate synthase large subunit
MQIAVCDEDIREFMEIITRTVQEHPVLVDKYLMGQEVEVDVICDGKDILIPGIMEHIDRAGIHSGDSISVYPAVTLSERVQKTIVEYSRRLAFALEVVGMMNIQFIVLREKVYIIEVNPRSSRTVPYISKVTGIPAISLATRAMLGENIRDMGFGTGLYKDSGYYAIKLPVFSFEKIIGADTSLGPEMKSTGEVLGIAQNYNEALLKAFEGGGVHLPKNGKIIVTVRDKDKEEICEMLKSVSDVGFEFYATPGTRQALAEAGIEAKLVNRITGESPNISEMLHEGGVSLVINTPTHGRIETRDGFKLRRLATEAGTPCLTSLDAARVLMESTRIVASEA